jgi:CheY-like chemotaxis protein
VLCCDRHAPSAELLARSLRGAGFDTRACSDGAAALVEVTDFRPHACVLDLETPGVGGWELAQWVRSEVGGLVFLIGAANGTDDELDRAAAAAGFDLVLARPADPGLVIGLLAGHARPADR